MKFRIIVSLLLIIGTIFLGVGISNLMAMLKKEPEKKEETKTFVSVKVKRMQRRVFVEKLKGYGVTRATSNTKVSAEITGVVKWISPELKLGQMIQVSTKKKKKLLEIDDKDLRLNYIEAKSNLEKTKYVIKALDIDIDGNIKLMKNAKREWQTSLRELKRQEQLIRERGISASDLDKQILKVSVREKEIVRLELEKKSQENSKKSSNYDIQLMQSRLQQAKNDLAKTLVYAPYSGYIVKKEVSIGSRTSPGTALFRIISLDKIEAAISLPASHYNDVHIGAKTILTIDSKNSYKWKGKVARISPEVDAKTRTFQIFVEIEQNKKLIPSGIFIIARVEGRRYEDVFVVPLTAVIAKNVFVVRRIKNTNKAIVEQKKISIQSRVGEYIIVTGGIQQDEEIVVTNVEEIATGINVSIFEKTP